MLLGNRPCTRVTILPWLLLHTAALAIVACGGSRVAAVDDLPKKSTSMMRIHTLGNGDPLLLVGGGLTGWLSWSPHQQKLAASRRTARAQLLIVQLGLDGQPVPADYSIKQESAALAATVGTFYPDGPLDLVGWSFGALVSLDFALDNPEQIRTLTLIEPPAFWVLEAHDDPLYEREREAVSSLAEKLRDDVSESDLVEFVRYASLCPPDAKPHDMPNWPVWMKHRQSLRRQFDAEFDQHDTVERLRQFNRPVLLVKGKGSTPALLRIVDSLATALPQAHLIEFEGGHAPHIVEMERFLEELQKFHANVL